MRRFRPIQDDPGAILSMLRLKTLDGYTYMHSVAVCALMAAFLREVGLTEEQCRNAAIGGLYHDIGKAHIPLEILNKPALLPMVSSTS